MLLRRIEVRNFRRLEGPVVIEGLGDGITVIAGDNEEGKSTLLDAIRVGLFERHSLGGKAMEAMQPFGSSVRPEIRLDFELDGGSYRITKGFAQRPSALLETPDGRFEGPAAEERLAELLAFRLSARGESKPDDRGVLGLFWLEQGRAPSGLEFGETGRATLRGSLEDEVGDVLGGSHGRALLDAARRHRDALLTATGRPRAGGALADAIERAEAGAARVAELERERAAYDDEIDELARVRRELARIDGDRVAEKARAAIAQAKHDAAAIEQLRQELAAAGSALAAAAADAQTATERQERRRELIDTLAGLERAADAAARTPALLERDAQPLEERLEHARRALAAASASRSTAEARVRQAQAAERVAALAREIDGLTTRIARVDALSGRLAAARERVDAIRVDRDRYEELQRLESAVGRHRAALDAVATRLRFVPGDGQSVRRDGAAVPAGEPVHVTGPTRFELQGFGGVDVEPGAADLPERRARHEQAVDAFGTLLGAVGAADLADARRLLDERAEAEAEARETGREIGVLAPEGVDALRAAHADAVSRRERLQQPGDGQVPGDLSDPETESEALAAARAAEDAARAALEAARRDHQANAQDLAIARQAAHAAAEQLAVARANLDAARERRTDAALAAALAEATHAVERARARERDASARLGAANPEEAALRQRNAEAALASVHDERQRLHDAMIGLESQLQVLGRTGLGEQLDEARGEHERAAARRERVQADADAWDLLVTRLGDAERDAKEAFLEPVLRRVEPFLRLILPDARVTLDEETLEITGVERAGRAEPYRHLSLGTREQLSILVRLAFAVYLRERGYPATVILDDALVYADEDRFDRMRLALAKASETVQILILTCRPGDWRQLGAPILRLADARHAASAAGG